MDFESTTVAGSTPAGGTKVCGKCELEKSLKEFAIKGNGYQAHCKTCQKLVSDEHYQRNKEKVKARTKARKERLRARVRVWIWDYLVDHSCVCGEDDPVVLDFDHRDPTEKLLNVAEMITGGYDVSRVEEEVAKCDVLCSNCHRKRTALDGGFWKTLMG